MKKAPAFCAGAFFDRLFLCSEDLAFRAAKKNQAAAETFASVATSEMVFRICEAIW